MSETYDADPNGEPIADILAREAEETEPLAFADECAIHGHEPIPKDYYRVCGECGHVFVTADELVSKDLAMHHAVGLLDAQPRDPERIEVCPECTHDF